jgi:nonribosomal peptide synthetase protein BlmIV
MDDFFRIGGHSLAAAELVSRARAIFNVDVGIRDVFATPTVRGLAARIDELLANATRPEDDVPLIRLPRRHERT